MLGYADNTTPKKHGLVAGGTRGPFAALVVVSLAMVGVLVWVAVSTRGERFSTALSNPPEMADQLDFFQSPADWSTGEAKDVRIDPATPPRLILGDSRSEFPRVGTWTSAERPTIRPFTELIPSYNPTCPPETGLRFDVRTRDARSGAWSPWFYTGSWGRTLGKDERETRNEVGAVNIDYLVLRRPADAYQVRVRLYAFNLDEKLNPALRRLTICYSGTEPDPAKREAARRPVAMPSDYARDLPVPFRAQGLAAKPLRPEICSPTSVSMVLQYHGFDRPTEENALGIYDAEYDLFGNWQRAVAWTGQNGFDAYLTRFRTWDQVKATIAAGQPIVASIRFKEGQCPSFVMPKTAGHLIVIRGVTRDGNFIVNDPASKDRGNGAVYKADDMARAWLDHGGVAYIIRRP